MYFSNNYFYALLSPTLAIKMIIEINTAKECALSNPNLWWIILFLFILLAGSIIQNEKRINKIKELKKRLEIYSGEKLK